MRAVTVLRIFSASSLQAPVAATEPGGSAQLVEQRFALDLELAHPVVPVAQGRPVELLRRARRVDVGSRPWLADRARARAEATTAVAARGEVDGRDLDTRVRDQRVEVAQPLRVGHADLDSVPREGPHVAVEPEHVRCSAKVSRSEALDDGSQPGPSARTMIDASSAVVASPSTCRVRSRSAPASTSQRRLPAGGRWPRHVANQPARACVLAASRFESAEPNAHRAVDDAPLRRARPNGRPQA